MTGVVISTRGAARWRAGHPWIYRSDVLSEGDAAAGVVAVSDRSGRYLGRALYSRRSEIRLRLLTREDEAIDAAWWCRAIRAARERREGMASTAYRIVHGEGDGLPSLIVDIYGPYAVAQLLSAGLEECREDVVSAIAEVLAPRGLLLRNDVPIRRHEDLPQRAETVWGIVPDEVEVEENGIRYLAAPHSGQKTGAFLDQRENRALAGALARGRALDVFTYQGNFALHMAKRSESVLAVDSSSDALSRGRANASLNDVTNIEWQEANAFDLLRELEAGDELFDVIVLDPPAFVKSKAHLRRGLAGYKEINLRAMRLLAPGGHLLTFSCSYHVSRARFLDLLADAAADSGRRLALERMLGQPADHPELLTVPETGYLKGGLLRQLG
jgi:23S rRNA (cytosine1962-C5)-methyltransferase